jgi:GTPase SAR1 family protein
MESVIRDSGHVEKSWNDEISERLVEICHRHGLDSIAGRLAEINSSLRVQVGFLGEWNSGKSTLINGLLGRKVLPVMPHPTTGNITEVEPRDAITEISFFEVTPDGEEREIDALTFSEIATGRRSGRARVVTPATDLLRPGFRLIDTPGLQSLQRTHTDITFGTLPFLDGAVICHDINTGALTASVMGFLSRPEVRLLSKNMIIALTKADEKDPSAAERIRKEVIAQITPVICGGNDDAAERRVVLTSAERVLAGDPRWSLDELIAAYRRSFIEPAATLRQERVKRSLLDLAADTVKALEFKRNSLTMNDSDRKRQEEEIESRLEQLRSKRTVERARLEKFETELQGRLVTIAESFIPAFENATLENVGALFSELTQRLSTESQAMLRTFRADLEAPAVLGGIAGLAARLRRVDDLVDVGVTTITAVVTAAVSAGTSLAANAGEAAAGAAVRKTASDLAKRTATSRFGKFVSGIGQVLRGINPFEWIGDAVRHYWKGKIAEEELRGIARTTAQQVCLELEQVLERDVFLPVEQGLRDSQDALRSLQKQRADDLATLRRAREAIQNDIETINLELRRAPQEG